MILSIQPFKRGAKDKIFIYFLFNLPVVKAQFYTILKIQMALS